MNRNGISKKTENTQTRSYLKFKRAKKYILKEEKRNNKEKTNFII